MRLARQRNDRRNTVYEVSNSFVGGPGELDMPVRAVRKFRSIVRKTKRLYVLEVLSNEVSERGYALICAAPAALPSRETVKACFLTRYGDSCEMPDFNDDEVYFHWANRIRDISCFFKDVQQIFSQWYNRTLKKGRRKGTVWADRFRSVMLSSALLLLEKVLGVRREADVQLPQPRQPKGLGRRLKRRWHKLLRDHPILSDIPTITSEIVLLTLQRMAHPTAKRP